MPLIGLIENDPDTLTSVSSALEEEGYNVFIYTDGPSAISEFKIIRPHLAIVQSKAPRIDGPEILRCLRQTSLIPVMLLTSKLDEADEIIGLRMGADDVVHKPFSQRILVQRVETLLKRSHDNATKDNPVLIECGGLCIDTERYICTWKGQTVSLTHTQTLMLRALARRPGIVMSRDTLIAAVYDLEEYVNERAVDCHIKHLRNRFKLIDSSFDLIETVGGLGYRLKEP